MRRFPAVGSLTLGVALLSTGLLGTAAAVAQQRQQGLLLRHEAAQVALAINAHFERAHSLDLLLAQNKAFTPSAGRSVAKAQADRALAYLGKLYPGTIGEACLIDDRGREIARVTQGVVARAGDLSSNESTNDFFKATLALAPGQVHQAPPYVSPDTKTWVISNSTWIPQAYGRRLVVHFEVALDSFQRYLTTAATGHRVAVVDKGTGQVLLQGGADLPATRPPGRFPKFAGKFAGLGALSSADTRPALIDRDGHRLAMSAVEGAAGNANDWVVVDRSTASASFVPPWVGGAAGVVGAGLILLFLLLLRRQHSDLRMATRLDHLTGIANRKALEEALDDAVAAAAQPGGHGIAVLVLDLDGFKQINDTLGHDKGDVVLREIGRRLRANTFEYDTAARLGGDEFAVVLRELRETDDVTAVAHRLREALVRPIDIDGVARFIGVSVGAAVFGAHGRTSDVLLRAADAAMYRAKRGREGVRVYEPGTAAGERSSGLAAELLVAIETSEINLAYQPEYALDTGHVVCVEALARWHRIGTSDVPPCEFIALAEQTGLIRQLTQLTLRKALDEVSAWRASGVVVPVSVNLSAQVVADRGLPGRVGEMLSERGLPGEALVLEITETAVLSDLDAAIEVLRGLRSIGVRIELDDFGSGYASFRALHELPLDGVKIDRELVNDSAGQRLLGATIDIARHLGLKVVAEGVENAASLELVRRLDADTVQGFHLARPMSPDLLRLLLGRDAPVTSPDPVT